MHQRKHEYIYVLQLQCNKFYVGKTSHLRYRLSDHFADGGAVWTEKYKPIKVREIRNCTHPCDEQMVTQEYMSVFGVDNVRGGPWCKLTLSAPEREAIRVILQSNTDCCYKCGEYGHFASMCVSGRTNHNSDTCFAKTDTYGRDIVNSDEEEETSDGEEVTVWCCRFCNKEFTSLKGAEYHENRWCRYRTEGTRVYESGDSSDCDCDCDCDY